MINYIIKEFKLNRGKIKFNFFNVYKLDWKIVLKIN